ncbi:hypothetical protein SK128_018926 [Halocaridina rubra]|uniref:Uncharacterized protein n=1 Tax=Halocaridina rubra TaxID=373956 RepID=A0AAN8XNP6_HALRR
MQHGHTGDHVEHVDFDSEGATINDMFLASFIPSSVTPRNSDELEMIVATMQHSCTGNYMGHTDVASVGATTSGTGKRLDGFACVELSLQQNIVINHDEKIKDNDSDNDSGIDSASFLDLQMEDFLKEISDPEIVLPIDGKQYRDTSSMAHCDADDFSVPKISDLGDCYGSCSMRSLENEYPNGDYTKNMDIESPFNTCSSLDYLPVTLPLTREYDVTQSLQSDLSDRTEEESGGINSGFERSAEKATLRRRRKEEMAQKVKEMREKQRSSEKWLEKKRMICNATCLYVVLFFLCFGILALFYQYYYMK